MYNKIHSLILGGLLLSITAFAQPNLLRGKVVTDKKEILINALVFWSDTAAQTLTDTAGRFEIPRVPKTNILKIKYVGYETVEYTIKPDEKDSIFQISGIRELLSVEIKAKRGDNMVSTLDPRNIESISSKELSKAPCCNLSESFETNGSVDIAYSDAVTGAKEIQMLGLRGLYTQLLVENRPDLYGIGVAHALEYLPGTWLQNLQISKGAGSVIQGFQAIAGQINIELQKPHLDKRFFINVFAENTGRSELNLHFNSKRFKKGWSHGLLLHGDYFQNKKDHNADGFIDMPLKNQLNGMYRVFYTSDKIHGQINVHALTEKRNGGQLSPYIIASNSFTTIQNTDRVALFGKFAYTGFEKPYKQLGSVWSATWHDTRARYGTNYFNGTQKSLYGNVIYATIIETSDHLFNYGLNAQLDDYQSYLNDKNLSQTEFFTGAFGEYTYNRPKLGDIYNDITFIAGLRLDYHKQHGFLWTPRLNFKYNFNENSIIRVAGGHGYRVSYPVAENIGMFANNRKLLINNDLRIENAWNGGINVVKAWKIKGRDWRISIDAYRTWFGNQIVADAETDIRFIQFYNLNGKSFANSLLGMLQAEILPNLEIKLAYKINDVQTTYVNGLQSIPFLAKYRGLMTIDYETPNKNWRFHLTNQYIGTQRLPSHAQLPAQYHAHLTSLSKPYMNINAQITRKMGKTEIYLGGENLTDYTQHQPIIAADNPTSPYFDATRIYAPLMGRRIYAGFRYGF